MKILLTGGSGYIGSVTTELLCDDGHDVVVFDNLERGHAEAVDPRARLVVGDLREPAGIRDAMRAAQPDAIIFVEANLHVGPSRSSTDATFNNPRINQLNEKLAALADGKTIFYIDINELFNDENGNLRADASGDSTHVYAKYDLDWCDWLCTKAIVR